MKAIKKVFVLAVLSIVLNSHLSAQCSANFTFTTTTSGIQLTNTSTGVDSSTMFNWNFLSQNSYYSAANGSTPNYNSLYNGTYTLSLTMSDSMGCSSSITQTITISGGQNAPACLSSFTYTLATGGQVNFTNTSPVDPYPNTSSSCTYGDGYSYGYLAPHTYYYNGNYVITLNVYNNVSGCSTSSSQTITITNAQAVPPCNSNFTYTVGSAGQVGFTSLYTGNPSSQNWYYGNGNYGNGANVSYTYPYNGTYSVTLNVQDSLAGCYSNSTQTLTITNAATIPCTPTVTFNMHQDSLNPQPGVWEISSYYSPQVTNAIWNWGDGTSSTGFAPTHNYSSAGQYTICVTVYSSCGDSSTVCQSDSLYRMNHNNNPNSVISVTVINENGTGIKNNLTSGKVSVYPNPGSGVFKLQLNNISSTSNDARINVTNVLGEIVFSSNEKVSNNNFVKELDLQNLNNGSYFLKVDLGGRIYTNKIVIAK